jgi:O-antigen/teichoic acid export membrane protein
MTVPADASDAVPIERHSVRRNLAHMMTSQVITWTVATIASVIIPRFVGPETLGDLRLANSLWLIVMTVTGLGTAQFLQLEIARHQNEGLALLGPTLVLRTVAFGMMSGLLAIYVALTTERGSFVFLVVMIGCSTLVFLWTDVLGTAFIGLERMSAIALAGALGKALSSLVTIGVVAAGLGAEGIVVVGVVSAIGGFVYMMWKFRQLARIRFEQVRRRSRVILRGSTTFLAASAALITYQQIDMVVISWVADSEDLGWYGASDVLFGSLLFPSTILIGTLFPTLGRLYVDDRVAFERMVARTFSLLSLVAVPIGLGTTLVAPSFAPMLYGEDFREAGIVLAVLGPVMIFTYGTILFGGTALATARGRVWVMVMFASAALTVPLDLVLVPWTDDRWGNGAIGGALAYVVTESLQFVIGIAVIAPYLLRRSTVWRSVRILLAGGLMFAAGWPLRDRFLLVPVVACACIYAVAIVALRVLGDEEKRLIGSTARRLGIRNVWAP